MSTDIIKAKYPLEKKWIPVPSNLLMARKPFRILAFIILVYSAYKALETCFHIINISSHLYDGAKLSSAVSQCLNIGTDDVSFHFFFFSFVCSWNKGECVRSMCLTKEKKKSSKIKKILPCLILGLQIL